MTPKQMEETLDEHLVRLTSAGREELLMRLTSAVALGKELVKANHELNEMATELQARCSALIERIETLEGIRGSQP